MKKLALPLIIILTIIATPARASAFFDWNMFGISVFAREDADDQSDDAESLQVSARALIGKLYERIEQRKDSEHVLERSRDAVNESKTQSQFSSSLVQLNYARTSLKASQRTVTDQRQYLLEYIGALISYDEYLRAQMEQLPFIDEDIFTSFTALVNADIASLRSFETQVRSAESVDMIKEITKTLLTQRQEFTRVHIRRLTVLAHIGVMRRQSLATLQARVTEQRTASEAYIASGVDMSGIVTKIDGVQALIDSSSTRLAAITASTTAATLGTKELQQIYESLVRERSAQREIFERILDIAREASKRTGGE
ncbi:MAG: hypothetical protein AAB343_00055 [Patescibacteria group bacterium]